MNIDIQDYDDIHKVIVIGDSNTGKTSLINTFCKEKAPLVMKPTIGVQFTSQIITIHDNKKIKTQIWDTAGQEKYKSITLNHYRKAVGAMIVFDLTNRHSFNSVYQWLAAVRQRAQQTVQIILIGNKFDLQQKRVISKQQAQKLAQAERMSYFETSIRNPKSINQAFSKLVLNISLTRKLQLKGIRLKLQQQQKKKRETSCPC